MIDMKRLKYVADRILFCYRTCGTRYPGTTWTHEALVQKWLTSTEYLGGDKSGWFAMHNKTRIHAAKTLNVLNDYTYDQEGYSKYVMDILTPSVVGDTILVTVDDGVFSWSENYYRTRSGWWLLEESWSRMDEIKEQVYPYHYLPYDFTNLVAESMDVEPDDPSFMRALAQLISEQKEIEKLNAKET